MDITRAKAAGQKQGVWEKNGSVRCASRRQEGMGKKRSRPWQGCKLAKLFGGQFGSVSQQYERTLLLDRQLPFQELTPWIPLMYSH